MKIHLYLDIDGVLNAYERRVLAGYPSQWPDGYASVGYEHCAPRMVEKLNEIIQRYGIRAHWLTTWMDGAVGFGQHFGIEGSDRWPILDALHGPGSDWPKFTSIKAHVEETKPDLAFWFDDDLETETEAMRWAFQTPGMTAFAPNGVHGITPGMLRAVERIIRGGIS
jgi:hypothetical protein